MFRSRTRGLFDATMAALAVGALVSGTPVGELALRLGRRALGLPGRDVALLSFLETVGRRTPAPLAQALAPGRSLLVHAFALSSLADRPGAGGFALTEAGHDLLRSRGASESDLAGDEGRLRALERTIEVLVADLGSEDLAVAALVAGEPRVRHAADRARALLLPPTLENLLPHLPFGTRAEVERVAGRSLKLATAFDLDWPVARSAPVTSRFGPRQDPFGRGMKSHTGVDLSVPLGTEVRAAATGTVRRAGEDGVNGLYLVVDHGRGVTSAYCHLSEMLVARGDPVARGQAVARSGNSGRSTGPHLHYQVELDRTPVDPLGLLASADGPAPFARR